MMNSKAIRLRGGAALHPDYKGEILRIVRSDLTPGLMAES